MCPAIPWCLSRVCEVGQITTTSRAQSDAHPELHHQSPNDEFAKVIVGIHQGSTLSTLLFTLVWTQRQPICTGPFCPWMMKRLTNEICLVLHNQKQAWYNRLKDNGMRLNIQKTEYWVCGPQTDGTISIDSQELKKSTHFKYFGSLACSDGDTFPDARA